MIYPYVKSNVRATKRLLYENNNYSVFDVRFPSRYKTDVKENNTVYSKLYTPKQKKHGSIIFVHGLGFNFFHKIIYRKFMEELVKKGFEIIFITMPYHLERTPPGEKSGRTFARLDAKLTLYFFEQAVLDIRTAIDWLEQEKRRNFSIIGISLGGIAATIAMALDRRIKKASSCSQEATIRSFYGTAH